MKKPLAFRLGLLGLAVVAALLLTRGAVYAAADSRAQMALVTPDPLPEGPAVPSISFIDSPTASCVVDRLNTGVCLINWYYLYADASPNYMITMTVQINDRFAARYQGFFQTSMYVPAEFLTFKVPCGGPGSGGNKSFGLSYNYTIRGRDSAGLTSANYGQVSCPADVRTPLYLPILRR